jgi:hypothetical protein
VLRRLRRPLAALFAVLLVATSASAHANCYFVSGTSGLDLAKPWSPSYPVITVSDRDGHDLNEYEAAYSWGSYSGDAVSLAYTTAQTCTYCIRIVSAQTYSNYMDIGQYVGADGFAVQCTIKVDPDWANTHTYWQDRQRAMANGIAICIGFEHATSSIDSVLDESQPGYLPTSTDYYEMSVHY